MSLEELAKMMGFSGEEELHQMVAAADLSTPAKLRAFQTWKEFDGSKVGLSKLLPQEKPAAEEPSGPPSSLYHKHYVNREKSPCPGCEYEKKP